LQTFGAIWAGWLLSQGWWREELWRPGSKPGTTFRTVFDDLYKDFIPGGDANDIILQMRTWEAHDIGTTPGFGGDVKKALAAIEVPVLYMPSATDLYFPVDDARYEAKFMPHVTLLPIPSLWGHTAGAASNPTDEKFLNDHIGPFVAASTPPG
jgi:homoserine O-acetyltransferase